MEELSLGRHGDHVEHGGGAHGGEERGEPHEEHGEKPEDGADTFHKLAFEHRYREGRDERANMEEPLESAADGADSPLELLKVSSEAVCTITNSLKVRPRTVKGNIAPFAIRRIRKNMRRKRRFTINLFGCSVSRAADGEGQRAVFEMAVGVSTATMRPRAFGNGRRPPLSATSPRR